MIPEYTKKCIDEYVEKGVPLGDFLTAVMANNLMRSFGAADDNNRAHLFDIVKYVYNNTPHTCHGNIEIVENWIKKHKEEREEHNE
jgi:hypothetical protein